MLHQHVMLFFANFVFIFLKAAQQRNVAHMHYGPVLPLSFILAFTEIYVIYTVVQQGLDWTYILAIGLGGGLGCMSSMYLHERMFRERRDKE